MSKIKPIIKPKFKDIEIDGCKFRCCTGGEVFREKASRWKIVSDKPNSNGYILVKANGKMFRLHRIIYASFNPSFDIYDSSIEIDHINRDKSDNRIANLRIATRAENTQNIKKHSDNRSGQKNICAYHVSRKDSWFWKVCINHNGNRHQKSFLGGYGLVPDPYPSIPQEVIDYRNDKLIELHGILQI